MSLLINKVSYKQHRVFSMKNNGTKKLTRAIVRNMFDTILNPIFFKLKDVNGMLSTGNLTWDPFIRDFMEIGTFQNSFHYRYSPNFEQLTFTEYPELLDINIDFDQKRAELNIACGELFNKLIVSHELKTLFSEMINEYEIKQVLSKTDADYIRKNDSIYWIAKYIINNIKSVPDSHIIHNIWNNENKVFFGVLDNPEFKLLKIKFENNLTEFKNVTNDALESVRAKNNELSMIYGEPIVPNVY